MSYLVLVVGYATLMVVALRVADVLDYHRTYERIRSFRDLVHVVVYYTLLRIFQDLRELDEWYIRRYLVDPTTGLGPIRFFFDDDVEHPN